MKKPKAILMKKLQKDENTVCQSKVEMELFEIYLLNSENRNQRSDFHHHIINLKTLRKKARCLIQKIEDDTNQLRQESFKTGLEKIKISEAEE